MAGLERFLAEAWDAEVEVVDAGFSSAGGRRTNLLFTAHAPTVDTSLVATIIPNPEMQAMAVEVESDTLRLARRIGMPVPEVHGVTTDPSYVGGPFFVSERIDGETIPRRVVRLVDDHPGLGQRLARQCGDALARLHSATLADIRPEISRPGDRTRIDQLLSRLERDLSALLQPSLAFRLAMKWLEQHLPEEDQLALVHGDFRNGNIVVGDDGLRGVLDSEACRIGDPMEDLAWVCTRMWRARVDHLEVGGFATRADLRTGYEAAGGVWRDDAFRWWKVALTLMWGFTLAAQARAHLDGSVPSIVMAASGRRVAELEYDALMLISPADPGTRHREGA
ncbi:MAG: phosphotransferase family protein [Acidimicrobiia bacterium]|nr:phosphotransferase family protein [Acidimicrobiia bacterium]